MGEVKVAKANLLKELSNLEQEMNEVSKKCFNGKLWKKEKLLALIEEKEDAFRNTKKTASEEKVMTTEMNKLKKSLELIPISEKILDNKFRLKAELKAKGKNSSIVYDKLKQVNDKINELRDELNKNKKAQEEEEKVKVEESECERG